jgi:hypothetical protein
MLLHNLLWLTYIVPQKDYVNYNGCSYPIPIINFGSNSHPLFIDNYANIDFSCVINQNGNVNLKANNSISLLPGFNAKSGSNFSAIAINTSQFSIPDVYPIYRKATSYNTCTPISSGVVPQQSKKQQNTKENNIDNININIFPNPATSTITLQYSGDVSQILSIEILNSTGTQMIKKTNGFSNQQQFDVEHFSPGVYCIRLVTTSKAISKVFIKS